MKSSFHNFNRILSLLTCRRNMGENNTDQWRDSSTSSQTSKSPKPNRSSGIQASTFYRKSAGKNILTDKDQQTTKTPRKQQLSSNSKSSKVYSNEYISTESAVPSKTTPSRRRNRENVERNLNKILQAAYQRYSSDRCNEWYNQNFKLRRAAFRELSTLKTFPIQEFAMKELDKQLKIHFNNDDINDPNKEEENDKNNVERLSFTSGSSLEEETKRRKDQFCSDSSDGTEKSRLKAKFLKERAIPLGLDPSRIDGLELSPSPTTQIQSQEECKNKVEDENKVQFLPALWSMEPRMFAIELSKTGKRKYVVGSFGRLADLYWRKVSPVSRHYYELIREETSCRLYFDLEFCKISNSEISSSICETILDELYWELSELFQILYPKHIPPIARSCILDLDSSTSQKFSRHWIVHLPNGALFANAGEAGNFVKLLVGRLAEEIATGTLQKKRPMLAKYLFVKVKDKGGNTKTKETENESDKLSQHDQINENHGNLSHSDTTCIIDLGVYTRNRLFRLMGAAKYGKPPSAALRIAETNAFPFPFGFSNNNFYFPLLGERKKEEEQEETESGKDIQNDLKRDMQKFRSSMDWTVHAEALAQTLVVPLNSSKISFPILPDPADLDESNGLLSQSALNRNRLSKDSKHDKMNHRKNRDTTMGPSPFPCLDRFVGEVLAKRGGVVGIIRAWSMDFSFCKMENGKTSPVGTITFQMLHNRYCENIGRAHKSNNIMWIVDLATLQYWQSCYDTECRARGFRGKATDLPEEVKIDLKDILFDMEMAQIDEKQFMEEARTRKVSEPSQDTIVANNNSWETEDDDAEFEKALLALNISGYVEENRKASIQSKPGVNENDKFDNAQGEPSKDANNGTVESNSEIGASSQVLNTGESKLQPPNQKFQGGNVIADNYDFDDALLKALEANPEYFP